MRLPSTLRVIEVFIGLVTGFIGLALFSIPLILYIIAIVEHQTLIVPETPYLILLAGITCAGGFLTFLSFRLLTNRGAFLKHDLALIGQILLTFGLPLFPLIILGDVRHILLVCLRDPGLVMIQYTFFSGIFFLLFVLINATFLTLFPITAARTPWTLAIILGGVATDLTILSVLSGNPLSHFYLAGGSPVPYYLVFFVASLTLAYLFINGLYALILPNQWGNSTWTVRRWNGERWLSNNWEQWVLRLIGLISIIVTFKALNHFVWPLVRAWSFLSEADGCKGV